MSYEHDPSRNQNRQLHICPSCYSELVQPTSWEQAGNRGLWKVWLRCPECEWQDNGTFSEKQIDAFDAILDSGAHTLTDELKVMERQSMEDIAGSFATALENDLIGPDDFGRPISG